MVATANNRTQERILFRGMLVGPWVLGPTHPQALLEEEGARHNSFVHHIGRLPHAPVFHVQHDSYSEEIAHISIDRVERCHLYHVAIGTVGGIVLSLHLANRGGPRLGPGERRHASRFANVQGRCLLEPVYVHGAPQ